MAVLDSDKVNIRVVDNSGGNAKAIRGGTVTVVATEQSPLSLI